MNLPSKQDRMIHFGSGVSQASPDIGGFKIRIIFENLGLAYSCGEEIEHISHPDTHSPNAGPTTALLRIEGDPIHDRRLA